MNQIAKERIVKSYSDYVLVSNYFEKKSSDFNCKLKLKWKNRRYELTDDIEQFCNVVDDYRNVMIKLMNELNSINYSNKDEEMKYNDLSNKLKSEVQELFELNTKLNKLYEICYMNN